MPDANPINPTYTFQNAYHQADSNGSYSRTVRVTATSANNPLTLTGSYANNAGFIVMNTGSILIDTVTKDRFTGGDFHMSGQNHQVYPIQLSYISASIAGDITVLYY